MIHKIIAVLAIPVVIFAALFVLMIASCSGSSSAGLTFVVWAAVVLVSAWILTTVIAPRR